MITGDNPLTAAHVARDVEIVDRDVMILDLREGTTDETDLVWRSVDDSKIISVRVNEPLDKDILDNYDICMTGAALKQFAETPAWQQLVQYTWVYARVSPAQKEYILATLRTLGYTTLMAGDGTNDVGALKQAHIGVALLNGSEDDLKKIAEHQKIERFKKVYESQLKLSQRFNAPPPPVPAALAAHYPEMVAAQQKAKADHATARQADPYSKVSSHSARQRVILHTEFTTCSST
jgi:cation-transporting ATPase 13A1